VKARNVSTVTEIQNQTRQDTVLQRHYCALCSEERYYGMFAVTFRRTVNIQKSYESVAVRRIRGDIFKKTPLMKKLSTARVT
jgi:hypothetical protein